eukprot:5120986-Pleurochrysis_carterae.AAC.1
MRPRRSKARAERSEPQSTHSKRTHEEPTHADSARGTARSGGWFGPAGGRARPADIPVRGGELRWATSGARAHVYDPAPAAVAQSEESGLARRTRVDVRIHMQSTA